MIRTIRSLTLVQIPPLSSTAQGPQSRRLIDIQKQRPFTTLANHAHEAGMSEHYDQFVDKPWLQASHECASWLLAACVRWLVRYEPRRHVVAPSPRLIALFVIVIPDWFRFFLKQSRVPNRETKAEIGCKLRLFAKSYESLTCPFKMIRDSRFTISSS